MPLPHATGAFKLAVQAAAALADDRKVLLAFKANEMQVRDKYARAAARTDLSEGLHATIRRAADDERRHYDWAVRSLEAMGATEEDSDVKAAKAFAQVHGRTADAIEDVERGAMRLTERARRAARRNPVTTVVTAGLALVGAGVLFRELNKTGWGAFTVKRDRERLRKRDRDGIGIGIGTGSGSARDRDAARRLDPDPVYLNAPTPEMISCRSRPCCCFRCCCSGGRRRC
jgi:hypothetical protein